MKAKKIDTCMAEKWLDPDTFVYQGKVYRINPIGKIVQGKKGGTKDDTSDSRIFWLFGK